MPNLWIELFTYDELTINMRQINDSDFVDMLNRIRLGVTTKKDRELLSTRLLTLKSDSNENRLTEIIKHLSKLPDDTVCLLPTKNMCQQLNTAMLRSLPHPEINLIAIDSIDCPRYLTKRARECIKKYEDDASMTAGLEKNIIIKIGAKVMLRRNIDVSLGLVNGSIGIVRKVKVDPENSKIIKRIYITFNNEPNAYELGPVKTKFEIINRAYVHREQFPICIAYAITIHKSQGLSLSNALMDIGSAVFTSGQAYVALSRVTSLGGLHLINVDFGSIKAQESSICEYNRLRSIYRPDLSKIETSKPPRKAHRDREWALRKTVAEAQEVVPEKKKRKTTYKNKKIS